VPTYEYKCSNGHVFEAFQSMADDPLTECEVCGAPVERVLHPVAVHFKGSGFYSTDYGAKSKSGSDGGDNEKESSKSSDSKPKSESKKDSKSTATPTSSDD
jgi:putative FmdB family regulatory protein